MTYAGNVADAIIECSTKMALFEDQFEVVNVVDETPVKSIYEGLSDHLLHQDLSFFTIPFSLLYPIYFMIYLASFIIPHKFEKVRTSYSSHYIVVVVVSDSQLLSSLHDLPSMDFFGGLQTPPSFPILSEDFSAGIPPPFPCLLQEAPAF